MNICYFSIVTYWHGLQGGMQNHAKLLLEGLADRGHRITVISTRHPSGIDFDDKGNIRLHYLPRTTFGSARRGWRNESLRAYLALNELERFDVICSQQAFFPTMPAKLRSNTPIITFIQGHEGWMLLSEVNRFLSLRTDSNNLIKAIFSFIYYYSMWEFRNFRRSTIIVPPSDEVANSILRWFPVSPDKVKTIYNGVDMNLFRPDLTAKQRVLRGYPQLVGKRIILFMGHVTRQKGLHLLIKIAPQLLQEYSDLKIMVVGGGDYLDEAKKMARELGIADCMLFTGMVDIDSIPDYINAADLFILPTLRKEGLPLSILEAMACKKPVITTNIGGNPSVVKNGINGILIPPANMRELSQSLHLLLNDARLASRLAHNGYESIKEHFSLNRMIDSYEALLEKHLAIKPNS
jgi:glycosyltransferase involved in cell wall biosynthesis